MCMREKTCILKYQQLLHLDEGYTSVHYTISSTFLWRFFKKKNGGKRKDWEERKWNQYTDNFSEDLVREIEKWGIGRKSESCREVFIF